ncbi:Protein phosphatase PP2A regulatory subunit B [Orobanche minor]
MGDILVVMSASYFSYICSLSHNIAQIEHASTQVGYGQTSLGIKAADCVVLATEKKFPSPAEKIMTLAPNIGVVYSGMGPYSRVLFGKSRAQAEQYFMLHIDPIPVTPIVRETATVVQGFTQSGGVRPSGVSLLVAGYDDEGPHLYKVDPSGSYLPWNVSAMGKNASNAEKFLEERYTEEMELEDAVCAAILALKEGFEGQISCKNIQIGVIDSNYIFDVLLQSEVEGYLQELE